MVPPEPAPLFASYPMFLEVSPAFASRPRGETGGTGQVVGSARDKSMTLGVSTNAECITTRDLSLTGSAAATFTEAASVRLVSSSKTEGASWQPPRGACHPSRK